MLGRAVQQQYADLGCPLKLMIARYLAVFYLTKTSKQTKAGEGLRKSRIANPWKLTKYFAFKLEQLMSKIGR